MLDTKTFLAAIDELELNNGIAREVTISALKEAFESIFKKKNYEDVRVEVEILPEEGEINIYILKEIVEEVEDDALQISLEDAQEINPDAKVGEDIKLKQEIEEFTKADALKFKSILRQKIKEAEKAATYALYADKTGEIIMGIVEKVEPRYTIINIGRTSVTLPDSHKIGDEQFYVGQQVKVFLSEVNASTSGPVIRISRSEPGFLKRLFEEEIPEIYDGSVVIKGVARKAGERSKVSVASTDINVDPIGACIGQGGTKIQKICQQLGKEKIDIVQYHDYPGSFIAEALKPAQVLGVKLDEENHSAIAVVKNDDLRVAIGKRGINAVLAVELTKWKIDIKELDTALAEGIDYEPIEAMTEKDKALELERRKEEFMKKHAETVEARKAKEETASVEEEATVSEDYDSYEEPTSSVEETVTPVEEAPVVTDTPVVEEEAPAVEEKVEYNPVKLNKDFSLENLEKELEADKKKNQQPARKKLAKKEKEEKVEKSPVSKTEPKNYMPIYSDDEEEEFEFDDEDMSKYDDDRFEEYDSDEYYEE